MKRNTNLKDDTNASKGARLSENLRPIAKMMLEKKYAQLEELYLEIEIYEYIFYNTDVNDSLKDILEAVSYV